MTFSDYAAIAEIIAAIAVVISLVYVGLQVRQSTRVSSAAARHAISQFALEFSIFKAEHADRLAHVYSASDLSDGDLMFRWWNHMTVFLHAETYYRHHELGLMPGSHWEGYVRYVDGYLDTPGVPEFWADVGPAFSRDFSNWVTELLEQKSASDLSLDREAKP